LRRRLRGRKRDEERKRVEERERKIKEEEKVFPKRVNSFFLNPRTPSLSSY
jgi:hypothetical protein